MSSVAPQEVNKEVNAAKKFDALVKNLIAANVAAGCDDGVKRVCEGVNGHLLHELLVAFKYHDAECVELLRKGVTLIAWLCMSVVQLR